MSLPAPLLAPIVGALTVLGLLLLLYPGGPVRVRQRPGAPLEQEVLRRYVAAQFERRVPLLARLRRSLDAAGYRTLATWELGLVLAASAGLGGLAAYLVAPGPLLALLGAGGGVVLLVTLLQRAGEQRAVLLETQLERFLSLLITHLANGRDLRSALVECVEEQPGPDGPVLRALLPPPLGPEIAGLVADLNSGVATSTRVALLRFAQRLSQPSIDDLVVTLIQGREDGSGLATLLRHLRAQVRDQRGRRQMIRAAMAQAMLQVYVLAALVLGVIVWQQLTGNASVKLFYRSTLGTLLVAFTLGYSWLGVAVVRRQARPEHLLATANFK